MQQAGSSRILACDDGLMKSGLVVLVGGLSPVVCWGKEERDVVVLEAVRDPRHTGNAVAWDQGGTYLDA